MPSQILGASWESLDDLGGPDVCASIGVGARKVGVATAICASVDDGGLTGTVTVYVGPQIGFASPGASWGLSAGSTAVLHNPFGDARRWIGDRVEGLFHGFWLGMRGRS